LKASRAAPETTLRKRLAIVRKSIFLKCVAAAVVLGESAVWIYFLWDAVRWVAVVLAVVVVLGVCIAGLYLLLGVIRKRTWAAVAAVVVAAVALGGPAVGIYFLPGALRWAFVVVLLGVCAVGIYLLWCVIRRPSFLPWAAVVVALCVCGVGVYLLWGVWNGSPVAAAFTRVGGATRVETSLEASRFWLTPPHCVVETQATDAATMFAAAQYAVKYDAPLLFISGNAERKQLIKARMDAWKTASGDKKPPVIVTFPTSGGMSVSCPPKADPANINGVSTLKVPNQPLRLRHVKPRDTLAHVVVFAAAIEPGNPSDVAVGLALAAHMAKANHETVSLVVIPHYLESDQELENTLESQHELVTGGVVLGETPTVPEDTRVLLRQLLTSTDRQGVAAQLQANLGSVASLIAALLALGGLAAAAGIAGPKIIEQQKRAERERPRRECEKRKRIEVRKQRRKKNLDQIKASIKKIVSEVGVPVKKSGWLTALGSNNREVIIWLRSGRQVTGTIEGQFPPKARNATVLRIKKTPLASKGAGATPDASSRRTDGAYVLVSIQDIELIHFNDLESETGGKAPVVERQAPSER
jgi:hypothetical protein